jgi:nitrite reductase (NADH) small subunit
MNALTPSPIVQWIDVGAVSDIPRRGARRAPTRTGDIALFRTGDDEVFALLDRCPHKAGPISQGIVHGRTVACPLHNWVIDLASGQPTGADAGKGCAPTVPVEIRDGRILLGLVRD